MSEENRRLIPVWIWVTVAFAAVGTVIWLASTSKRPNPPDSFRYDVAEHEEVEPSLVLASESAPLKPGVAGLKALAATPDGHIVVAGDHTLVVCNMDGVETGRYALSTTPECVTVAPDGKIVLGMLDHVEILDAAGKPEKVWASLGERAHITSVAADEENLYVADAGNRVILRFDYEGNLQTRIGEKDEEREIPGLVVPSPYLDVAFDNMGALWAVNPGRHGLEQYRPNGDLVSAWYRPSMDPDGFCGCCNPAHAAFRSDGTLVTAEKGLNRVKLYSVDQKLLGFVADPKVFRASSGGPFSPELETPFRDLAVDAKDRILVLDANANAVRVFEVKEPN